MQREIYNKLIEWKNDKHRKPLLIKGARQVGKTFIIKQFGKDHYTDIAYFNFEEDSSLHDFFQGNLSPEKIIDNLSIAGNKKILQDKTLIIFDEVQECSQVLTSLKYFNEYEQNFHIIASGSLLGIKLSKKTRSKKTE